MSNRLNWSIVRTNPRFAVFPGHGQIGGPDVCGALAGGILADQMGLGKTVQTIGFLSHLRGKVGQRRLAPGRPHVDPVLTVTGSRT